MLITKNTTNPIGLDISDLSIKLIQLSKSKDKIKIQALGKIDLPKGVINNGIIKDKDVVIKTINELLSMPGFGSITSREVVACLPEPQTFIKLINIEKTPNRLTDVLENEIEKYIPMPVKDMYYDWQVIKEGQERTAVLIGAAPRNIVNQYVELLRAADLSVSALEIESTAICRALLPEESPRLNNKSAGDQANNYCLIDIGANRSSLIIYSKNTIVLSISIPISGNKTTENISKTLEISRAQAEKAKIVCGLDKSKAKGIIYDILSDMIDGLVDKIKKSIEFYNTHYPDFGAINKILLCGGGANIKKLPEIINQSISIEVTKGDSFINLNESSENFSKHLKELHSLSGKIIKNKKEKFLSVSQNAKFSYTTAIGLALRDIF